MIDVKVAAKIAIEYAKSFYPDYTDFQVEEIEKSEDNRYWYITIGMDANTSFIDNLPASSLFGTIAHKRIYKNMKIDIKTGETISMKIRKV
ncbi:MAG: hypothetical protein QM541_06765 [Flavobacterium sp.]|nr:hypothetical protein [Flavobacterium sp.]